MKDFAVPETSLALMASAFFFGHAAVQIPVGFLSGIVSACVIRYLGLASLGVAGALLLLFSTSINMATWARLLTGAGTAGIWIQALKYLSISYRPDEFATRTSIINAIGSLGLMLSTLPMALSVEKIGWRYSFVILRSPCFFWSCWPCI